MKKINPIQILLFACAIVALFCDADAASIISFAAVIPSVPDQVQDTSKANPMPSGLGANITGGPLTNKSMDEGSPDLRTADIDEKICKISPTDTPVDQISRLYAKKVPIKSLTVDYYSVDTKSDVATSTATYTEPTGVAGGYASAQSKQATIPVSDPDMFDVSSTISVLGVNGYESDGTTLSKEDLMLIVINKDTTTGNPIVMAVNGKKIASSASAYQTDCVPTIASGSKLLLMGRAATELDAQSPQYSLVPTKLSQNCQIFMIQVEQSTYNKIAKKEVDWSFEDVEEGAVLEMKMGIEKSLLFSAGGKKIDPIVKAPRLTTRGIWWQAGKEIEYGTVSDKQITENELVDISREVFTGSCGGKKKILFVGSELLANLMKVEIKGIRKEPQKVQLFGLDFTSLVTRFGELLVFHHDLFNRAGREGCGLILDPEYLTKATHKPWEATNIDFKAQGTRNTDAVVLSEASCLYLKYPTAHARIVPKKKD